MDGPLLEHTIANNSFTFLLADRLPKPYQADIAHLKEGGLIGQYWFTAEMVAIPLSPYNMLDRMISGKSQVMHKSRVEEREFRNMKVGFETSLFHHSHLKHLHHLIPQVVDHLHGDAATGGFVEGT